MRKPGKTTFTLRPALPRPAGAAKPGRRPAGPNGERVSEYPQVMIRLPRQSKQTLAAVSALLGAPVWQVVDEAVAQFVARLPAADRRLIAELKHRRARRLES